jgi:hypothetical protein
MKGSTKRRTRLLAASPYKGTGRFLQYVRCPCCGKLARGAAVGSAGTHKLSVSRCVRRLPGSRGGFEWKHEDPSADMLRQLLKSLGRATSQVEDALWHLNLYGRERVAAPARVFVPMTQNIKVGVSDGRQRIEEKVRVGVRVAGSPGVQTRYV